jgi:hypothetical protein
MDVTILVDRPERGPVSVADKLSRRLIRVNDCPAAHGSRQL